MPQSLHIAPVQTSLRSRLDDEWNRIADLSPVALGWPELAVADTLDGLVGQVRIEPDRLLGALIRRGRGHDPQAATARLVVLRCLLGKLISLSGRDRIPLEEYLVECWLQVAEYPLERRPRSIAANLWLDTRKRVIADRVAARRQVPVEPEVLEAPQPDPVDPQHEVEQVLAEAGSRGLIDADTRDLLCTVYRDGLSGREAAVRHGTTVDLVRWRCSKALRRLSGHALELAA